MADVLQKRGMSEDQALEYASLIGDTPETDGAGKLVVRNRDGIVIDRIDPID